MVEAKDRGGEQGGNAATCSLEIKILDVNDNIPVVESHTVSTITTILSCSSTCQCPIIRYCAKVLCTDEMRKP